MENILIKYEADASGLEQIDKQLAELNEQEERLLARVKLLDIEYNAFLFNLKSAGKTQAQLDKEIEAAQKKKIEGQKAARAEVDNTRKSIAQLKDAHDKLEKAISKGASATFIKRLRDTKEELSRMSQAGDTSSQRFIDLSVRAEKLRTQIALTEKTISTMASTTKNMDTVMGVGQGLTGTFTAATSAVALLGGESEELQKAFFKVQAALQILNGVQMLNNALVSNSTANIVLRNSLSKLFTRNKVAETAATTAHTTATVAETTVTNAATVATKGFTKALLANPVFWIVAVIAAVVVGITKLVSVLNSQSREQEKLNELEKIHLEYLEKLDAIAKQKSDEEVNRLNRELELMAAKGAIEEELAKKQDEINQAELKAAEEKAKRHKDEIDNLEKNRKELSRLEDEVKHLQDLQAEGKGHHIYYLGGVRIDKSFDDALKYGEKRIEVLKKAVDNAFDATEGLEKSKSQIEKAVAETEQKAKERANRSATAAAEYRVMMARKGSEEELKAQVAAIVTRRNIELQNVNLTAEERKKIAAKANEDIRKLNEAFQVKKLQDEKTGYEAELALVQKGSLDELNLKLKSLEKQKEIDLANAALTDNERLKITNEYEKNVADLTKEFNRQQSEDQLNAQISTLEARLAAVGEGSAEELDLRKQLLEAQSELERKGIEATIANEELRAEKIKETDAKLKAEKEKADRDYRAKVIEHDRAMADAAIEAERIKNEEIVASGNFIERMQARTQLKNLELQAIDAEMAALEAKHAEGIVSEMEYQEQLAQIKNQYAALELTTLQENQAAINQIRQEAFDFAMSLVSGAYESRKASLQQELDDLQHYYTTDAEEAKKNRDLKLISEEELARRELEIKREMATAEKRQALFEAMINAAVGITKALSSAPPPFNAILAAITAAAAAVQIAQISNQPLPKYAKGRKGGKGEMAWVGERGPEVMWIPEGASIIPAYLSQHVTPEVMRRYDIPMPKLPQMPSFEVDTTALRQAQYGLAIDYDKLGRAVAENVRIPEVSQLNVSMDEDGFKKHLLRGNSTVALLNKRFNH